MASQLDDPVNYSNDLYHTFGQKHFSSLKIHPLRWPISSCYSHLPLEMFSHFCITQIHRMWVSFLPTNESPVNCEAWIVHQFLPVPPCWPWTMKWCRNHLRSILNYIPNPNTGVKNSPKMWTLSKTLSPCFMLEFCSWEYDPAFGFCREHFSKCLLQYYHGLST